MKIFIILSLLVSQLSYATWLTGGQEVDTPCNILGDDGEIVSGCKLTFSATTIPTVIIGDEDDGLDTTETISFLIEEKDLPINQAKITQEVAAYLAVEVQLVQDAVLKLYTEEQTLTLDSIKTEVLANGE